LKPVQAGGAIQALQFRDKEEKQLIQVRTQGFSFNRLAPYSTLDEYLPEIERLWNLYTELAAPVKTRAVKLRYINRIILPMNGSLIELDEYLKTGPRVPGEEGMTLTNFLIQHSAVENATNLNVSWVLTSQVPADGKLPIILDITVGTPPLAGDPNDWATIRSSIDGLRILKNRVFENILSPKCLELFQ